MKVRVTIICDRKRQGWTDWKTNRAMNRHADIKKNKQGIKESMTGKSKMDKQGQTGNETHMRNIDKKKLDDRLTDILTGEQKAKRGD